MDKAHNIVPELAKVTNVLLVVRKLMEISDQLRPLTGHRVHVSCSGNIGEDRVDDIIDQISVQVVQVVLVC